MKKVLSVVLCAVMIFCCIPFAVNAAAEEIILTSGDFTKSDELTSGKKYVIPAGATKNVPSNLTLYIPSNTTLEVAEGANLNVIGDIIVLNDGYLKVNGFIYGASNVSVNGNGTAKAAIRFPALDVTNGHIDANGEARIEISYWSSSNGNIYEDLEMTPEELEAAFDNNKIPREGATIMADLNQYLYIRAHIKEPVGIDKYDDALLDVYINGVGIPYTQGSHHTMLTTAGNISYGKFNENALLKTYNIYLPTGQGYTVYGREGEQSADGETVKLKYGQSFSFKVEIDPEYDMSTYEVYVYNGYGWTDLDTETLLKDIAPAKPDEYGYYHIGPIQNEHTIYVVGVVKNETLLMVGDILSMIKNVFEMITAFFQEIAAFFGINLGGSAA